MATNLNFETAITREPLHLEFLNLYTECPRN
jgi:hypothetical protein